MKMCSKTHQIAPFKKISRGGGDIPQNPPSKPLHGMQLLAKTPKSCPPPLANPGILHIPMHVIGLIVIAASQQCMQLNANNIVSM